MQKYICTVLMISYNHELYIREAIESVLEQKTKYSFKLHMFDDCSKDKTREIINEYVEKYPDKIFPYFQEKNRGAQGNIWDAYASVDTKYCILLECDDYWCDKTKLERQISVMERHPECSFCGHDTRIITVNEMSREYTDGALTCINPIMKKKNIFEISDFDNIYDGGYSPYVSARLLRSSCFDLSEIKYKESFLFDHTQFYYLLLKGKYYYIDRPMSVYRRTDKGTSSSEEPLKFLNTFIENSLDFNKETNYVIARKIFQDCLLQTDFRLMLDKKRSVDKLELLAKKDKINIVAATALGDTYILAGLSHAIEKKWGAKVHFIIKPQYEIVMKMYEITDYTIFREFGEVDWEQLKKYSTPTKGQLFLAHPCFYEEYHMMYFALKYGELNIDFLTFFKQFLGLKPETIFRFHTWVPEISEVIKKRLENIDLDKVILFAPEANSVEEYRDEFWEKKAKEFKDKGYTVVLNVTREHKNKYAQNWNLSLEDSIALAIRCKAVYSTRSGYCDLLIRDVKQLHIYYNTHSSYYIFGIERMFGKRENISEKVEFIVPIREKLPYLEQLYSYKPIPLLFGIIRIPDGVYKFYNTHKKFFNPVKSFIKKLVSWK